MLMARMLAVVFGVLAVVLGVVVVVQAVMLRARGWRIAWGSLPDWLVAGGGLATVGALVVALLVYRRDVNIERRQQAESILAWTGDQRNIYREIIQGQGPVMTSTVGVNILNASKVVIYDLALIVLGAHAPWPTLANVGDKNIAQVHEGWEQRRDRLAAGRAQVVPPGRWNVRVKLATPSVIAEEVHLFFRDHQGVYWWRNPEGQVVEHPAPPPNDPAGKARIRQVADTLGEGATDARLGILIPKPLTDAEAT
ncbi:MAG: hypothetical protein WBM01_28690 [Mycobacterium sp.]